MDILHQVQSLLGVTFQNWNSLFSHSKASDVKTGIIANFFIVCEKLA